MTALMGELDFSTYSSVRISVESSEEADKMRIENGLFCSITISLLFPFTLKNCNVL